MKKSNPLKTFNDNHDKRVDSFNKNLKKFQGDIGGSQVSADSTSYYKNLRDTNLDKLESYSPNAISAAASSYKYAQNPTEAQKLIRASEEASANMKRQSKKGKPGYDTLGNKIKR
jgi:hypothetical protein